MRDLYRSVGDDPAATLESKRQAFDKICENYSPGKHPCITPLHRLSLQCRSMMIVLTHFLFAKLFDTSSWNTLKHQWRLGIQLEPGTPDRVLSTPLSVTYLALVIGTHQIFLSTRRLAKWCILILA